LFVLFERLIETLNSWLLPSNIDLFEDEKIKLWCSKTDLTVNNME
jgi:hypothetical protein